MRPAVRGIAFLLTKYFMFEAVREIPFLAIAAFALMALLVRAIPLELTAVEP